MIRLALLLALSSIAAAATPTVTLTVTPTTGAAPLTPTANWSSTGATSCTASWGAVGLFGTKVLPPISTPTMYTITCSAGTATSGVAQLAWSPPTQNTDGTPLTDLVSYNLYEATSAAGLATATPIKITAPANSYSAANLAFGTWYFAIAPVNAAGKVGAQSTASVSVVGSASTTATVTPTTTVPTPTVPNPVTNFTVTASVTVIPTPPPPPPPSNGLSTVAGWHRIPSTAVCGGGPEKNPTFSDPDNFPANLGASASYVSGNKFPGLGGGFASKCQSMLEDSNSGAYDTARHRLLLFGGGHQAYWGNDVYSLELSGGTSPFMAHLTHPANPFTCPVPGSAGSAAGTAITTPDGAVCQYNAAGTSLTIVGDPHCTYAAGCTPTQQTTPGAVHTYNALVYVPGQDSMVAIAGVTNPYGNSTSWVWSLAASSVPASCAPGCDPKWTAIPGVYDNPQVGTVAAYDPNTGGVWVHDQYQLRYYDPVAGTLTKKASQYYGYHSTAVVDPLHKYFIIIGPASSTSQKEGILYVDISSGSSLALQTPTTTGCANVNGGTNANPQYMGLAWDPVGKRVAIYPNAGNAIWYLDPATWTCTSETYGATQGTDYPQNTVIFGGQNGTFGHFAYDPAWDVFVLCNDPNNDCWYLRPRRP
ncbi:MAG: hypothetical protein JSR67_03585 [Proteobacteria bacterium]|nr:hypothetical protein [Pseudomonadota bacterium]